MLRKLVRCPLQLFEAYPIGRIINRFSYDMFVIDQKLPSSIQVRNKAIEWEGLE